MATNNRFITSPESLVTTHAETRAGFLSIALEKNRVGDPFVKNALAFKAMVAHTHMLRLVDGLGRSRLAPHRHQPEITKSIYTTSILTHTDMCLR